MAACEERIPIYPIRYTIKEKQKGKSHYAYQEQDLETGYPKLKHSQYTTRLLREGFVYIYDASKGDKKGLQLWKVNKEGSFTELTSLTTIPDSDKEKYKTGHQLSYISACAESTEVYIGFTDTLWTKDKYADIVANKGNIRDNLMSKINVKEWAGTRTKDGTHKGKDTFPAEKIKTILEEYKDKKWETNLAWSRRDTQLTFPNGDALQKIMSSIASRGQIIVALHDNIGLLEDQKMLIHHYKSFHAIYTQKHHRKKLIADLIDQVYTQNFATEKKITDNKSLKQVINQDITQLKQSYNRHRNYVSPEYTGGGGRRDYRTINAEHALKSEPKSNIGYRSAVLTRVVKRQAKHVKEAERLRWLNNYNKETKKLLKKVIEAKNDRCELLKTYTKIGKPTDVGSSFLTYDKDNPISGGAHAQAFANITEGMMADVSIVSGVKNCEHDLFDKWWQKPLADNPQLINLRLDDNLLTHVLKNKPDTVASIASGLDAGGSILAPNFATTEITHNLVVYTLTKDPKWRGAVLKNIDAMFQKMLNAPSEANAKELRTILEGNHQKLTGKYKASTTIQKLSPKEFVTKFGAGAQVSEEAVERILHSGGSLKGEQAVFNIDIVHVKDQSKLKNLLDNPFGGKVSGTVSVLALALFAFNLKVAITTINKENNWENRFNLGSAVFGLGSGINAIAMAMKPVIGTEAYARLVARSSLVEIAAGVGVMRFFGYGGAILEGITQGIRSYKAHSMGDTDAGNYYALASVALLAGGIIVTEASIAIGTAIASGAALAAMIPIAGWIVAGILLLGLGIWAYLKANDAIDTPMEKWLDCCSFGAHERSDSFDYKTEKNEHGGFVDALYAPQILSNSWNHEWIGKEDVTFEIYQPAKDKEYRFAIKPGTSRPIIDTTIRKRQHAEMRPWNPDGYHTTVEDFESAGNGFRYKMHVKNIPNNAKVLTGCLYYIPMLSDNAEHWVKHCFQITRGWGWGSDTKAVQSN